ncbi:MAG: P-loop NTPase fold protein [Chloroflexota bacterium]|nr:P-loop NTPase fold protein [Chloroflexota bacterium]
MRDPSTVAIADRPITTLEQDRLGRARFAEHIAAQILKYSDPACLVVALYGRWGSGKTSLLNLIEAQIREGAPVRGPAPIVLRFNPWHFAATDQLIAMFFRDVRIALGLRDRGKAGQQLGRLLETLAVVLSAGESLPGLASLGRPSKIATLSAKGLTQMMKDKTLEQLRAEIYKHMMKLEKRLVVMIDDLDRLEPDSMLLMLRLIRLSADMPNTTYVLAFDRGPVASALDKAYPGIGGQAYLEKIAQVALDIPRATPQQLETLFLEGLQNAVGDTSWEEEEQDRWRELYLGGLRRFILTPRDVIRCLNGIKLNFPMVRGEVNAIDFITLEVIRTFNPGLYAFIADPGNRQSLLLDAPLLVDLRQGERPALPPSLDEALGASGDHLKQPSTHLLLSLFPRAGRYFGGATYDGGDWDTAWRAKRRMCSLAHFDVYLLLCLPEGAMSEAELSEILGRVADQEGLVRQLRSVMSEGRITITRVLEYFDDHCGELSDDGLVGLLGALFTVADEIPIDPPGAFDVGPRARVGFLALQAFAKISDEQRRDAELTRLTGACPALTALVSLVNRLEKAPDRASYLDMHGQPVFSDAALGKARRLLLERIRQAAREDSLLGRVYPLMLVFRWKDWASTGEVAQFLASKIQTDEGLLQVLVAFIHQMETDRGGKWAVIRFTSREYLATFLDIDVLSARVKTLKAAPPRPLSPDETLAIETFLDPPETIA